LLKPLSNVSRLFNNEYNKSGNITLAEYSCFFFSATSLNRLLQHGRGRCVGLIRPSGAGVLLLCLLVTDLPCGNFLLPDSNNMLTLETQPCKTIASFERLL